MTIVEFLHPIKRASNKDICLAAMYFNQRYQHEESITVEGLRGLLKRARIPKADKINLADVLSRSAPHVDTTGKEGNRFLWVLTSTGQDHVRSLLNLPSQDIEIENDVATLENLTSKLNDSDLADYVSESVRCLQVNALRASVVFLWSGAVKTIRDQVFSKNLKDVNTAILKHDPKSKQIKRVDDLVQIKEVTLLLAAQELGLFDKNEKSVLTDCLNLRNKCGHPGKYKIGPKKVSSFIEDIIGILYT